MNEAEDSSLAMRLKQGTSQLHRQAERSGVMVPLVQGRIEGPAYRDLLTNLLAIYRALEAALEQHCNDPLAGFTAGMGLQRSLCLAGDLAHLFPRDDAQGGAPDAALVPAATAYVERLQALAASAPSQLVAHAYVRYLGDLHGGQVLGRIVRQRFGLTGEAGTRFYEFGDDAQVRQRRAAFRDALDALPVSPAQCDAIVAEAVDAFARHVQLFEELAARPPAPAAASR